MGTSGQQAGSTTGLSHRKAFHDPFRRRKKKGTPVGPGMPFFLTSILLF